MAIFVPGLILNDKQFVEKSFIHSKSTSACCCFFTLRGQGFRNWFQTPKLLPTKCWYSRRKGHGHKRYLCLQEFKIPSHIPLLLYFLPPVFALDWATSLWPYYNYIHFSPVFFWIWTQWFAWNSVAVICALGDCITLARMFLMIPHCFEMLFCTPKPIRSAHSNAAMSHKHIIVQMSIEQGSDKRKRWTELYLGSPCSTVLWIDSVCSRPGQCLTLAPWHLSCTNSPDGVVCLI